MCTKSHKYFFFLKKDSNTTCTQLIDHLISALSSLKKCTFNKTFPLQNLRFFIYLHQTCYSCLTCYSANSNNGNFVFKTFESKVYFLNLWWVKVYMWFQIGKGVRQGRILSPSLFNLYAEYITHSSVLAWRIPGMGKPGGLLSMGLHRVRHD